MGNNKEFRTPLFNFTPKTKMSLFIIDGRAIVKKEEDNNNQKMTIFMTIF